MDRPVVAVHQPNYLPWLGWFAKACLADVVVLLDDVQFEKGGFTNRVQVKGASGPVWLTVPVLKRGRSTQAVADVEIDPTGRWVKQHGTTLRQLYGGTPGWDAFGPPIEALLQSAPERLARLNEELIRLVADGLGVTARFVRASELGERRESGHRHVIDLCARLDAATYVSGAGARAYQDPADFEAAGIALVYSPFAHPTYPQRYSDFAKGVSAVDLLFNCPDDAARLLRESVGID